MYSLSSQSEFFNEPRLVFQRFEKGPATPKGKPTQNKKPGSASERVKSTKSQGGERLRNAAKKVGRAEKLNAIPRLKQDFASKVKDFLDNNKSIDALRTKMSRGFMAKHKPRVRPGSNDTMGMARIGPNLLNEMAKVFRKKFNRLSKTNKNLFLSLLSRFKKYELKRKVANSEGRDKDLAKAKADLNSTYREAIRAVGGAKSLISKKMLRYITIGHKLMEKEKAEENKKAS